MDSDAHEPPHIDRAELDRLYGPIADELAAELIGEFRADSRRYAALLANALEQDPTASREEIRRIAHTVKGSASAMAATSLTELARDCESAADSVPRENLAQIVSRLVAELERFFDLDFDPMN